MLMRDGRSPYTDLAWPCVLSALRCWARRGAGPGDAVARRNRTIMASVTMNALKKTPTTVEPYRRARRDARCARLARTSPYATKPARPRSGTYTRLHAAPLPWHSCACGSRGHSVPSWRTHRWQGTHTDQTEITAEITAEIDYRAPKPASRTPSAPSGTAPLRGGSVESICTVSE